MRKKLTDKQKLFISEYLVDMNATQAYLRAGYKVKNKEIAQVNASKLLLNTMVLENINLLIEIRNKKLDIDAQYVLKEAVEVLDIAMGRKAHKVSYIKENKVKKIDVFKTNLSEANKALVIIGKHVNVKAFEKNVALYDETVFVVTVPKEIKQHKKAQD